MPTAKVGDVTVAESSDFESVEGNVYFPPSSISKEYFKSSSTHTTCPWKGEASYYDIELPDGTTIKDAAWYYPATITEKAEKIKDYVAFYKSKVDVTK